MKILKFIIVATICAIQLHEYTMPMEGRVATQPKAKLSQPERDNAAIDRALSSQKPELSNQTKLQTLKQQLLQDSFNKKLSVDESSAINRKIEIINQRLTQKQPAQSLDLISQETGASQQNTQNNQLSLTHDPNFVQESKAIDTTNQELTNPSNSVQKQPVTAQQASTTPQVIQFKSKSGIEYESPDKYIMPEVYAILKNNSDKLTVEKALQDLIINSNNYSIIRNLGNLHGLSRLTGALQSEKSGDISWYMNSKNTIPYKLNGLKESMAKAKDYYKDSPKIADAVEGIYQHEISKLEADATIEKAKIDEQINKIIDQKDDGNYRNQFIKFKQIQQLDIYHDHKNTIEKLGIDAAKGRVYNYFKKISTYSLHDQLLYINRAKINNETSKSIYIMEDESNPEVKYKTEEVTMTLFQDKIENLKNQLNQQGEDSITAAFNNIYHSIGSEKIHKLSDTLPILFRTIRTAISNLFASGKVTPEINAQVAAVERRSMNATPAEQNDPNFIPKVQKEVDKIYKDATLAASSQQ